MDSMNETRKMYDQIFEISKTKNHFKNKLEKNFSFINYLFNRECQNHQFNSIKNEDSQKALNASLNILKKRDEN